MSVRYVLTAVLPRYTMRRTLWPAPPAGALGAVPDPPKLFTLEQVASLAKALRPDLEPMGHD